MAIVLRTLVPFHVILLTTSCSESLSLLLFSMFLADSKLLICKD